MVWEYSRIEHSLGPFLSSKASEVWALVLCLVHDGAMIRLQGFRIRGPYQTRAP